ncbi:hypothetical protein FNV68_11840 [Streptomyces sp. S1D4-23]|nr:hypothetical protein FNV61_10735 [Streptomyces sp. RLB3-6]QDO06827.1 hypothetical protein FNV68_11840 [Streptomyces sp. S1D4-23]
MWRADRMRTSSPPGALHDGDLGDGRRRTRRWPLPAVATAAAVSLHTARDDEVSNVTGQALEDSIAGNARRAYDRQKHAFTTRCATEQRVTATEVLRRRQVGACTMCSASRGRLTVDHSNQTGLVRGLPCAGGNTAEAGAAHRPSAPAGSRRRPPAGSRVRSVETTLQVRRRATRSPLSWPRRLRRSLPVRRSGGRRPGRAVSVR